MKMLTTYEELFCDALDRSIPQLKDIDVTFKEKGLVAAEHQLAEYLRENMRPDDYFTMPYQPEENSWHAPGEALFDVAEKIISGELCSVGLYHKFPDTASVDWEFNPTENQYAEWTWQLSRHHEWRCLAYCYHQTGDERYAKAFTELFMSWCEQAVCPENAAHHLTKCWRTIEAGIRMALNWHYAFYAFYRSPYMPDHVITTFVRSLCDHGHRLKSFHGGGNWITIELSGLAILAIVFPFLRKSDEWAKFALSELENELDRQVYDDGFQFELSSSYHDCVIACYHRVFAIAKALKYPLPECLTRKVLKLFEADIDIVCPDGRYPDINDGSRSGLFDICKIGIEYFPDHETIKYFSSAGKIGSKPAFTSVAHPCSGHAFMRTGWSENDLWCMMDAGDFGRQHQHEDKLNVLLYAYGKNLLPDSGNYAYDSSQMRRYILSTHSHNCALVDGHGQNRRAKYTWDEEALHSYAGMAWSFSSDTDTVEGIYNEGYGQDFIPVTHKRKLILFKKGIEGSEPFMLVIDRFIADDGCEHTFTPTYQLGFAPYVDDTITYTADFSDGITFSITSTVPHHIISGQTEPDFIGWRKNSDTMDATTEYSPAPCLLFPVKAVSARIVTLFSPHKASLSKTAVSVTASDNIDDTEITLTFSSGAAKAISESDYPCHLDGSTRLYE